MVPAVAEEPGRDDLEEVRLNCGGEGEADRAGIAEEPGCCAAKLGPCAEEPGRDAEEVGREIWRHSPVPCRNGEARRGSAA